MEIYLAPVGFSNTSLLEKVLNELTDSYIFTVKKISLDLNIQSAFSTERKQYFSSGIIAEAIPLTSDLNGKVLVLTEYDLYIPVLTFVFGEAQLNGKHSVVSVCRLHEEFYSGLSDDELLFKRTIKEILHELGHNFGLRHCDNWDCVMHSSPGIEEVDIKGSTYCSNCVIAVNK